MLLLSFLQGKNVVVVGAGKTAHDVGTVVSKLAASTTLVARRGHWMAPQTVLGECGTGGATYMSGMAPNHLFGPKRHFEPPQPSFLHALQWRLPRIGGRLSLA